MDHQRQDEEDFSNLTLLLSPEPAPQSLPPASQSPPVVPRPVSKRRGKKRSSRACTTCRARKVRCNIIAHGAPCSNCRHDEVDCILPLSRRQRSAKEREECMRKSANGSAAGDLQPRMAERHANERCHNSSVSSSSEAQRYISAPHGMRISEHVLSEVIPTASINPGPQKTFPVPSATRRKCWNQISAPLASAPRSKCPVSLLPRLPKIFAAFPAQLDPCDLSYLQLRGALAIPSEEMQVQLLRAYVEFVHGAMPLLDADEFMAVVKYGKDSDADWRAQSLETDENCEPRNQISLLLFQAVMFAGTEYVSMRVLREEGYETREMAQKTFFSRVRLLYDFDTCTDRLPIIQALLLMTRYAPRLPAPTGDGKNADHWLGLAISLSYSLGLHRSIYAAHTSPQRQRLERRVWWTCFMRDRTLALSGSGKWAKPLRIKREDCDVDMLSLDDFELYDGLEEGEGVDDRRTKADAVACVERALLCWCSSDTLVTHNSITPVNQIPSHPAFTLMPELPTGFVEEEIYYEDEFSDFEMHESTLSPSEDCITPCYDPPEPEKVVLRYDEKDLERGYGVDDEYDDYLEYFGVNPQLEQKGKRGERGPWALELDCESDKVIEV